MLITDRQSDALRELINIAFSRTAGSLSQLTGSRVTLDPPVVNICPIGELCAVMGGYVKGEVATVHQIFTGKIAGDALLLLNYPGAVMLTDLLTDQPAGSPRLSSSSAEALREIGNILLNACLGVFGNLLSVQVSFSVPRLHVESFEALLHSLIVGKEELRYALVVHTEFRLRDNAVNGYLMIALGISSLDQLLQGVDRWDKEQSEPLSAPGGSPDGSELERKETE
jgi:chemotaxis protein CheC